MVREERGFTLVEVLVVIVVIGVLAAIALPSFLRQRNQGYDADAKHTAGLARGAMARIGVEKGGFAGTTAADLVAEESALKTADDEGRLLVSGSSSSTPTADGYVLAVQARKTGTNFAFYKVEGQPPQRFCAPADTGGCGAAIRGVSFPGFSSVGSW